MISEIGSKVQDFYNRTPFPDYELGRINSKEDLKALANSFAKILDRSIPEDASIIDIGTGTGQLSAFLSLRRKKVYGIDFSEASLKKAQQLKEKLNLETWHLRKVDILDEEQIEDIATKFDYLLCLGVLHHIEDPYMAFKNILKLLKPKGYIAIGLYNKLGRMPLKFRKFLVKTFFRSNEKIKNSFIKKQISNLEDKERARGWWNDQYNHPHESTHTLGEILNWFKKNNITICQTIPTSSLFDKSEIEVSGVWHSTNENYPNQLIRLYKQLKWVLTTNREGGYWITLGRKN